MSHELVQKRIIVSVLPTPTGAAGGPVDFNATGDKFIFTPPVKCLIYKWGLITIEELNPDAGGFVLALDHRTAAGSDTGRTEKATITLADAEVVAAASVVYNEPVLAQSAVTLSGQGISDHLFYEAPRGPVEVNPGEEAVIEVTNAVGAVSTGYVWLEYAQMPFDISDASVSEQTS